MVDVRTVDNSEWDGNAAMTACKTAADYRAICAGRKEGPADERSSWALPHHKRPGGPPNAAGVRNSLSRLPQTQGLTNREAARRHLEAHLREIQPKAAPAKSGRDRQEVEMAELERRYTIVAVELRTAGDQPKIGGYAARFNSESVNLGGFVEVVRPTFFNDARGKGWPGVMARYNHDDNQLLGTTGAGTLRLDTDSVGLVYEVVPPNSRADVVELVARGDVRASSFAFRVPPGGDDWTMTEQDYPLRSLEQNGQLVDVAPVNSPAYPDATAGLRSLADKFDAAFEEVRSLAAANELRRFFRKTEVGMPAAKPEPLFGAAARMALLEKEDPWD